jgi:amidase
VADAALLLDALTEGSGWATGPLTWGGGAYLNAAVRGEGRYQLGVMTSSVWDNSHEITLSTDARAALDLALREFDALGHGLDPVALESFPAYDSAFRTLWEAGAASIPAEGVELALLEPLTRWLVGRGRALDARRLAEALEQLAQFERRVIRQLAGFDAVLTPALAHTAPAVGWFDQDDGERNFDQQVRFTPFTSFVNVCGLPAITLPVAQNLHGLPVGVQLVGRPGGEHVLLALGAQLERRLGWHNRHPAQW